MAVTMTYGTYTFNPVPLLDISKEYKKAENGQLLSTSYRMSLNGTLTPLVNGNLGGISNVLGLQSSLISGLKTQGCTLTLKCNNSTLLSANPRINNISFKDSNNHLTNSIGYSIDMDWDDILSSGEISGAIHVEGINDEWNLEPLEEKSFSKITLSVGTDTRASVYKLGHQVSAKGNAVYTGCATVVQEPWIYASNFCSGRIGYNNCIFTIPANTNPFNHNRTQILNKEAGKCSINENWLLFASGDGVPGNALEDFTIDVKKSSSNDIITVSIQGQIQGLEDVSYTGMDITSRTVNTSKYANALNYWSGMYTKLLPRAQYALDRSTITYTRALNPLFVDKSVSENIPNGVLSYNYEFSNRASPCIANAYASNISFSYKYPQDVFASIQVLGRKSGPVIQLMGTRTPYTLTANIDVVVPIVTGCTYDLLTITGANSPHASVKTLLSSIESSLGTNDTLVKMEDSPNWIPFEGKYNRTVVWLYNKCADGGTKVSELP